MFADIAFPISSYTIFTYSVPNKFRNKIKIGQRVNVPFGKRNITGIVVGFPQRSEYKGEIKGITSLVDPYPILDSSLWKLIQWMSTYYFTPIGQVAKTVLPKQLSLKYSPQKTWMVELKDCSEKNLINIDFSRSPAQKIIFDSLTEIKRKVRVSKLKHLASDPLKTCKGLEKKMLINLWQEESIPDITGFTFDPIKKNISFSKAQQSVLSDLLDQIEKKKFISNLLHGVTGSGKTEIYIEAVKYCLKNEQSAILKV